MVKLSIFNTSRLVVSTRDYYKKKLRKIFPEISSKKISIPSFVYLIEAEKKMILFNSGTAYKNPMGSGLKGMILEKYYQAKTSKEIWHQLEEAGINYVDSVVFSHLHPDHVTGALRHGNYKIKVKDGFYADRREINAAQSFRYGFFFPKKDLKKIEIKPLSLDFKEIESLLGHTAGGHIGFWVNKKILLVGDAIETPFSLCKYACSARTGHQNEAKQTIERLRSLAEQDILLLSNHDLGIRPTNGENFIGSEQHKRLLERQESILNKINLYRI